jgi:catechol 2,3-dioxygenase-like lactoylglutathione lyase family enzyme
VRFYRAILGLAEIAELAPKVVFAFGLARLWLDRVPALGQTEVWLEVQTDDARDAAAWLAAHDVTRCDAVETLPDGFRGFRIANPAAVVHLVSAERPPA